MDTRFNYQGFNEYIPFFQDKTNIGQFKPNVIFNYNTVEIDFNLPENATTEQM